MTIGGSNASETYIDDVELTSLDLVSFPVPECLSKLSGLAVTRAAGGLNYARKLSLILPHSWRYPCFNVNIS